MELEKPQYRFIPLREWTVLFREFEASSVGKLQSKFRVKDFQQRPIIGDPLDLVNSRSGKNELSVK